MMIAVRVEVEMRYKTEEGFVIQTDETPVGQVRFLYSDNGKKKLGKAIIYSNGYNLPKLYSSQSGEVIEKGKTLFFTNGAWTYRLRHMGETKVS
jgi:hypothetical protein